MIQRDKWEYMTTFLHAHVDNEDAMVQVQQNWPGWKPKKYAPETLIPGLNNFGSNGWELVHMQPIGAVGKNQDVGFVAGEAMPRWSNSYFCVFKRPKG